METDDGGPAAAGADEGTAAGGTLVIRTWFESGRPDNFRARITCGRTSEAEQRQVYVADRDEALKVVHQWLAAQHADRNAGRL